MARIILIGTLCVALAFLGVSGVHAHLPGTSGPDHSHGHAAGQFDHGHHAGLVTFLGADHFQAHDDHGDIDIDPVTKAFGKLTFLKVFAAAAFVFVVLGLLNRLPGQRVAFPPPRRPPKNRLRFSLLPPSHAPPCTALSR